MSTALRRHQWELAAYYLLLGFVRAALEVPHDSLEEMIRALEGDHGQKESG